LLSVADFANYAKICLFVVGVGCLRICYCNTKIKTT